MSNFTRSRSDSLLSPQMRVALRMQIQPRLVVVIVWTLCYLLPAVLGGIAFLLDSLMFGRIESGAKVYIQGYGMDGNVAFAVIGFALTIVMFKPLISNGIARRTIVLTGAIANACCALSVAVITTVLSALTNAGLLGFIEFHPASEFGSFAVSRYSVFGFDNISGADIYSYGNSMDYFALFLHIFLFLLLFVSIGDCCAAIWVRLSFVARIVVPLTVVVLLYFVWMLVLGTNLVITYITILGWFRGRILVYRSDVGFGADLYHHVTVLSIWVQMLSTVLTCTVCMIVAYFTTKRRELGIVRFMNR